MRPRTLLLALLALSAFCAALLAQAPVPPAPPTTPPPATPPATPPGPAPIVDKIVLQGGDIMTGLVDSVGEDGTVFIASPGAEKPIEAQLPQLRYIQLNTQDTKPAGYFKRAFIFKLVDGTRITGKIIKWTPEKVTINNEYFDDPSTENVVETAEINVAGIRHISTSTSDISAAWNEGKEDIIILNNGQQIKCTLLPLEPVDVGGGKILVSEIKYKLADATLTLPITDVRGIVFPRKNPVKEAKPPEGLYTLISVPNGDRITGVLDSLKKGMINLITQYSGVLHINRILVRTLAFSSTFSFSQGNYLVCDSSRNRVIELDSEMKIVWTYDVNNPLQAKRLENGNILISCPNIGSVIEVDYQKQIVWRKDNISTPYAASRLANGNTIIAEYGQGRIVEIKPDGTTAGTYFQGQGWPTFVEAMPNGNLLVVDQNNRVFEGGKDNKIIRTLRVNNATCAHVLPDGKIAVLEPQSRQISIFDADGQRVATIANLSYNINRFAVTAEGNIIVANYVNNNWQAPAKILEYTPDGKLVGEKQMPEGGFQLFSIERD